MKTSLRWHLYIFNSRSTILQRWKQLWCWWESIPPLRSPSPVSKEVFPLRQGFLPFQGEVRDSSETFGESGEWTTFSWWSRPETFGASLFGSWSPGDNEASIEHPRPHNTPLPLCFVLTLGTHMHACVHTHTHTHTHTHNLHITFLGRSDLLIVHVHTIFI